MEYKEEHITEVMCPLVDELINDIDCIENRDCVDGIILLSSLPEKYKKKEDFINICKKCKWHNY
jgi:hypothetical protein